MTRRGRHRMRAPAVLAVGAALLLPAAAQAVTYAPPDQPGPPLSVPQSDLDAALACKGNIAGGSHTPVLLVPGTAENPKAEFSWNWQPALEDLDVPYCTIALPQNGTGDIQEAAEYVVNAIRTMNATAGERIDVVGHSQGGMLPRWVLRFWPDIRPMVDDLIGLAPSNHGTLSAIPVCVAVCPASFRQQAAGSEFNKALNSYQETFPGISYTVVYTHTDEVVTPNLDDTGSSPLHGGGGDISNVAVQQICPLDVNEHLGLGTYDPVAWALALDAVDHSGPADPSRIPSSVCTELAMPGVNPANVATDAAQFAAEIATAIAGAEQVPAEPPLRCYVTASCPASGSVAGTQAGTGTRAKAKCKRKRKRHHRAQASKRRHCKKRHKHR
jgi:triacylglycerol esterase/lipase EstA (alpha/beta hydrolase family)